MCGIVGYAGNCQAMPLLLEGLEKLEYRGYDSAGVCIHGSKGLLVAKVEGRLDALRKKMEDDGALPGTVGIGHTRWATHGAPSVVNSHPHLSFDGKIAVVHNGIIENEVALRRMLLEQGITFLSETDTEVVANLIGLHYRRSGDFAGAVRRALKQLEGSYAFGILCADEPGKVIAAKKNSPLIFGFGQGENFIASDVTAILRHTQTVTYLDDDEMVIFTGKEAIFSDIDGKPVSKKREYIAWSFASAERGGYDHFMFKEIMEQPKAIQDTISPRIRNGRVFLEGIDLPEDYLRNLRKIYLVACGSAYYVCELARYTIEQACRIPSEAMLASEFRYCDPVVDARNLVIIISQSGETADTLAALQEAKRRGAKTLAIVNVVGSAIAKAADQVIYTWAGPEIAVATTKAFSTQLAVIYLLTLFMADKLGSISEEKYVALIGALERLHKDVEKALSKEIVENCRQCAKKFQDAQDAFYIGRNLDSAICFEGSLKLKEVAYLHSEAYPAGELKHGPISLIEKGTLVVAVATVDHLLDKILSNIREVEARGARILCITSEKTAEDVAQNDRSVITVPQVMGMLQPSLSLIPLQLFAYFMAVSRNCDVDKPRNLAKSVTVE